MTSVPLPVQAETAAPPAPARWNRAATAIVVLLFITAGHIWSLDTGLFLDDHAHFEHLRESPWTIEGLVEASRLGIVGDVMDLWGRREAGLRFFRPVAFAIMKLEYTISGWRPLPMHLFSLAWHFACAMLVGELAWRCLGNRFWAGVAAALMAIHPGHVATVYWIACQTELITTAFLLVAVLAYGAHAGWRPRSFLCDVPGPISSRLKRALYGAVALLAYALALGCRENAVLFPLVCLAGDFLLGPRPGRRLRILPLLMLGVLTAYLVLRSHYLGGFQMPARPYIYPPRDPGFVGYVVEKVVYYTIGLFGFVPVIPMGGQAYFASRPWAFYGGFAGTIAILLIIWAACHFRRALLWPCVWIACTIAPVIPVFASSHHLYLPSVGTVLILTAGLAALGGLMRNASEAPSCPLTAPPAIDNSPPAVPRAQRALCGLVLLLHAVGLSLFTWGQGFAFRAGTLTEDILLREIRQSGRPIRDGDHFFFINMPILAYYAIPALESELGWNLPATVDRSRNPGHDRSAQNSSRNAAHIPRKLHGHVLTFSPWLMRMEKPGALEVVDEHRLRIRAPDGECYFGGVTGRTLLQAMGLPETLPAGRPIRDDRSGFTVTPTQADECGVREFLFEFDRPIDSPNYHFIFGSPQFLGYPVSLPNP